MNEDNKLIIDEKVKNEIEEHIKEINKIIKKPLELESENSTEIIYKKPKFKWCLNEEVKEISKQISKQISNFIKKKSKKYDSIRYIDLFSGSTIFSLNIIKNLYIKEDKKDEKIFIEKVIFNDISYNKKKYKNLIKMNEEYKDFFDYKNIDIHKTIYVDNNSLELENFKQCFEKDKKVLNIIFINPIIGKNGFDISIINKIEKILPKNSILFFVSTKVYKNEKLFTNKKERKFILNENLAITNEDKKLIEINKIFNKDFDFYENNYYNNLNKYNVYIYLKNSNEQSLTNLFFDGNDIYGKKEIEKIKTERIDKLSNDNISLIDIDKKENKIIEDYKDLM